MSLFARSGLAQYGRGYLRGRVLWGLLALLALPFSAAAEPSASLVREGDRVVVVGDSITGQSVGGSGFVTLMREALAKVHPDTKTTITPLGGSGQTVGSWLNVEKQSRDRSSKLDVPNVDVKATLDGGADVIIIMLGMNDALSPSMGNTPADLTRWIGSYRTLVGALRERSHPRVVTLATPTLCTEDDASPKNVMMAQMSAALADFAKANDCTILPVRDTYQEVLRTGRMYRPDFHVTADFVHPSPAGHLAIAQGMLEGLGEKSAAKWLREDRLPAILKAAAGKLPALSYTLTPLAAPDGAPENQHAFKVAYWYNTAVPRLEEGVKPQVQLTVPAGWKVTPASVPAASGEFTVSGPLDRWQNRLTLTANLANAKTQAEVVIEPAWLVGVGNCGGMGWNNTPKGFVFDLEKGRLPIDTQLAQGLGFDKAVPETAPLKWAKPITWKRYVSSINYTGGAKPGSIDLAAVNWFGTFDVAYGARWIYSPTARELTANLDSRIFAGTYFLTLWVNGQQVHASADRKASVPLKLNQGWNPLVFKSNHVNWQWQFNIDLAPAAGQSLDDLRFSTTPGVSAVPN